VIKNHTVKNLYSSPYFTQTTFLTAPEGLLLMLNLHFSRYVLDLFTMAQQPPVGQDLFIIEDSWSHSNTPHSVRLLWTSDQPVAETSTWQHTTFTRDTHSCPQRDLFVCLFLVRQLPVGHGLLIHEVSRSHTTMHHSR